MPVIVWDEVGSRRYESGLDKGVLYLPDGVGVPWNGLTSINEKTDKETSLIYYDGVPVNQLVVLGNFSATMKAVTYPDEFVDIEGLEYERSGVFYADQSPKIFGLCYRTQISNDIEGDIEGYKIHIIYNVLAIPNDKSYSSVTDEPSLVEFEWNITAIPEEVPGFLPTAHIIIDSRKVDPWLLEELETILYGSTEADAILIPTSELVTYISEWYRVKIVDHGDGTWSAISDRDGFIDIDNDDLFTIIKINAVYLDDVTFLLFDTFSVFDVPQIRIHDNDDGTWSATTEHDNLIVMVSDTEFEIRNANVDFLAPDHYRITDTSETEQ